MTLCRCSASLANLFRTCAGSCGYDLCVKCCAEVAGPPVESKQVSMQAASHLVTLAHVPANTAWLVGHDGWLLQVQCGTCQGPTRLLRMLKEDVLLACQKAQQARLIAGALQTFGFMFDVRHAA
jgi:hypothetical protein